MRLIHAETRQMEEFSSDTDIPPYAILSHTWGKDEISFQDWENKVAGKAGLRKIELCCEQAVKDHLDWIWVDTCCIDKRSSAELSEAINSMFRWYQNAVVCYVYLADVSVRLNQAQEVLTSNIARSRWFTRGWTLQELLAPRSLEFFSGEWIRLGSKYDFTHLLESITGIERGFLCGDLLLEDASIAKRMSWAASRKTTKPEDMAYCLLGIFNITMSLLYGEGRHSFRRLQEQIIKRNTDLTIFAWDSPPGAPLAVQEFLGIFAPSPTAFSGSSNVQPFNDDFAEFLVTNKGILFSGNLPLRLLVWNGLDGPCDIYGLFLGADCSRDFDMGGIFLRKLGPGLFCRDGRFPLAGFWNVADIDQTGMLEDVSKFHVVTDPVVAHNAYSVYRRFALHIPVNKNFRIADIVPESLWDITDHLFLRPKPYSWCRYETVLAVSLRARVLGKEVQLVVLCDCRNVIPILRIFELSRYSRAADIIFRGPQREMSVTFSELEKREPELAMIKNEVDITVESKVTRISVSAVQDTLKVPGDIPIFSIALKVGELSVS